MTKVECQPGQVSIVDGEPRFVVLDGDASGIIRERTSLYGCDCNSTGSPGPFALVLLVVLRRRRR